jgi:glyoxylase-like metal-dependent hydrolase (beta-lactamase superfamily II)
MPHDPFTVGRVDVIPLCDGWAPLSLHEELPGRQVDWASERARYPWVFPPDDTEHWAWHVHSFLLRHPDGWLLVDTGIGHLGPPRYPVAGKIDEELHAVGVDPGDITHVVYSHLHADHSGGACYPDGTPRFPDAKHHVHPEDWAFFGVDKIPPSFTGRFAMAAIEQRGMLRLDPEDHDIVPGVRVAHAPGHTPGHRVVFLEDQDDMLLLAGDLLHVPAQIRDPMWPSDHDEDREVGARERARRVGEAKAKGWVVAMSHFGRPFGRITADGWLSL